MTEAITVAIISGGLSLFGTVITLLVMQRKTTNALETHQAVTDNKIENLTREVRKHNNFAGRMPVLEEKVCALERQLGAKK